MAELFDCSWSDDAYDMAVMDEFAPRSVRNAQWLNQFSDGQSMFLRTKGGQVFKQFNVPLIVLSNYAPEEIFGEATLLQFKARFQVVRLEEPINLEEYQYDIEPLVSDQ